MNAALAMTPTKNKLCFPSFKSGRTCGRKGLWKTPPTQYVLPSCHAHRQESQMPENLVCEKPSVSGHGDQKRHAKWRHEVRPGGATPVIQTRERDSRAVARSRSSEAKYTSSRSGAAFSVRSSVRTRLYSSLACVFDLLPVVFDLQVTFEVTVDFRWRASFSPQLWRVALSGGPCPLDVVLVRPRCRPRAWRLTPPSHLTCRPPALDAVWARRC